MNSAQDLFLKKRKRFGWKRLFSFGDQPKIFSLSSNLRIVGIFTQKIPFLELFYPL